MELNDKYVAIRSNILMTSLLPSVMVTFNLVSQEESHKSLSSRIDIEKPSAIFSANKSFKKSKAKNLNLKCTHCGGQEHLVERCFKLIGYPEKRDFSKLKLNKFVNNVEGIECNDSEQDKTFSNTTARTPNVIKQLLKLVNSQKISGSSKVNMTGVCAITLYHSKLSNSWIVDSRATDHMVHDLSLLFDIIVVPDKTLIMNLPNGNSVNLQLVGKCCLSRNIVLEKVLFVPMFKFNLLSVSKITQSGKLSVRFCNKLYYI